MELCSRIEKLETDINLITSIRDILMTNREEENCPLVNQNHFEKPVRGPSSTLRMKQEGKSNSTIGLDNYSKKNPSSKGNCIRKNEVSQSQKEPQTLLNKEDDTRLEKVQEEILIERQKRKEIEESSQMVVIQLQKVEDELKRERDVKRNLLVGTLQMKNQLQGYHTQILELEKEIATLQEEKETLCTNKTACYLTQVKNLENEILTLKNNIIELDKENEYLKANCVELQSQCKGTKDFVNEKEALEQMLNKEKSKCAQVEMDKMKTEKELQSSLSRLKLLQEKSKTMQMKLQLIKKNSLTEQNEKDKQINCLQSVLKQERDKLSLQIDAATKLVSKTTSFIKSLQEKIKASENKLQKYFQTINKIQSENKILKEKAAVLQKEISYQENFKERFWSAQEENSAKIRKFQDELITLRENLREERAINQKLLTTQDQLREEFSKERSKWEKNMNAKDQQEKILQDEIKRISDNLQILKKISEDQGKTIQKQRNELENSSESQHKFQVQLRESHETEKVLSVTLSQKEKHNGDLQLEISHLEHQLSIMEREVKTHNCEEFVESKFLSKVTQLEDKVIKLERHVKTKEEEKNKAVAAARKALRQAEELKKICDNKIVHTKNHMSQEILKIQEEKRRFEIESNAKIRESESENLRLKEAFGQMQNAYLTKIHQLQSALTACVAPGGLGGHVQGTSTGFPVVNGFSSAHNFNNGRGYNFI